MPTMLYLTLIFKYVPYKFNKFALFEDEKINNKNQIVASKKSFISSEVILLEN
jgi:hypothetical protein